MRAVTVNGMIGTAAPMQNIANDDPAAFHGDPPRSSGLIPSSSRAITSSATARFAMTLSASARAPVASRPRDA